MMNPTNPMGIIAAYRIVDQHVKGILKNTGSRERAAVMLWERCQNPNGAELQKAVMLCGLVAGIDRAIEKSATIETSAAE